jgi:taurine dioxygenase
MALSIEKLTPHVGALISGVDAAQELDEATGKAIVDSWLAHGVILLRGQTLTDDDQARFSRLFGTLTERSRPVEKRNEVNRAEADPYEGYTMLVTNIRENGKPIGSLPDGDMMFHADLVYREIPSRATILYGIETPEQGGDTLFASLTAAYEALDDESKALVDGKRAMQGYHYGIMHRENNEPLQSYVHPLVQVIPETGRKALFASRLMTMSVEGMDKESSDALLERLFDHIEQPQFVYVHQWRPGDLLVWDNRATVHARTDFDPKERRLLRRLATTGARPVAGA